MRFKWYYLRPTAANWGKSLEIVIRQASLLFVLQSLQLVKWRGGGCGDCSEAPLAVQAAQAKAPVQAQPALGWVITHVH